MDFRAMLMKRKKPAKKVVVVSVIFLIFKNCISATYLGHLSEYEQSSGEALERPNLWSAERVTKITVAHSRLKSEKKCNLAKPHCLSL